jgi:hypothetical protein
MLHAQEIVPEVWLIVAILAVLNLGKMATSRKA